jgi:hypothetical protein
MNGSKRRIPMRMILAGLAGTVVLGGCATDRGYGYGGLSVGTGYYDGGYYDPYYGSAAYGGGYYSGWYNDYYYPGRGYYVYDRRGARHRWNDGQRAYWERRRENRGENANGAGRDRADNGQWRGDRRGWSENRRSDGVRPDRGGSYTRGDGDNRRPSAQGSGDRSIRSWIRNGQRQERRR